MNNETISYKHSFNSGDLISVMCGIKHVYDTEGKKAKLYQRLGLPAYYYDGATHPVKNVDGENVCMNEEIFSLLKPLLLSQYYIDSVEEWRGEKCDIDFDLSRDRKFIPMPAGDIHYWPFFIAPQLSCDLSKKWLCTDTDYVKRAKYLDKIVINRTERYQNPYISYHFLKPYQNDILFVGTDKEYELFCSKWQLDIERQLVDDFYELAAVIENCKFFIGNQSFCYQISEALKVKRILEYCPQFPNCHPKGANGYAFLYQEALELYVHKLLN